MSGDHREAEHFLTFTLDADGRDVTVLHPEGCPTGEIGYGMQGHTCAISRHIDEWGFDLHLADVEPGLYLATYWYSPPSWAGPVAIDANDGIELTRLVVDPEWP